jgi:hypothetical protein
LIFNGLFAVSPSIPYNNKFVQHGFTKSATFEGRVPAFDKGLLQPLFCVNIKLDFSFTGEESILGMSENTVLRRILSLGSTRRLEKVAR